MKRINLHGLFTLTLTMGLMSNVHGQISVTASGAGPLTFPSRPLITDGWTTIGVGDNAANITTSNQLETAVQALNAANIVTRVGTSSTDNPFSANAIARFNETRFRLQSKPTGVDMTVLMATLRNDTGMDITAFDVSYLHAVEPAGAETPTGLNGWFAYYSTTGAPGTWQPIAAFTGVNANGTLTTTITPSSSWSPGLSLYIIWADDNGGGTEGGYTMDDFTIANVITDILPVSITITSPTNTQRIVQGVTVNVTTTSTGPIQSVDFLVDGTSANVDTTPPYGFPLDTTGLSIGNHTLQAIASDGVEPTPSTIVNFEVVANTPPTIVITNLAAPTNFLVGTAIPVNAAIADDVAVTNVDWYVDGNLYVSRPGALGFTYVDSLVGSHTFHGVATDSIGQQTTSASVTVNVTNPAPAIFSVFLPNGSDWKYFNAGTGEPSDVGFSSWYNSFHDDTAWPSGPAEIGNGDTENGYPERTMIDIGTETARYPAIYFRNTFTVANLSEYPNVVLRLLRDDGAVVYLNDAPVWTNNMATTDLDPVTGNIAYTNLASGSDDGVGYQVLNVPPSLLVDGLNYVAVEVHQANATSSDVSFDMMIWGERATAPTLTITSPTNGQRFLSGVPVTVDATASTFITNVTLLVDNVAVGSDDTRPFSITASNLAVGNRTLVARGRDQFGGTGDSPPVTITIVANQPPTVTLTNPPGNLQMLVGGIITLGADATDADGTVTRVEFHDNGVLITTPDTSVPYSRGDVDLTAGVHTYTAVAFDNSGASTVSAPITVTVTNPPNATALLTNRSEWKWVAVSNDTFGTTWVNAGYDDSAWNVGRGKFGFGGDGEHTVVGVTNIPSFYFRKVLNVPDPSALGDIVMAAIRDDGLIVHVNGTAVRTDRITGTPPIPFSTLADSPAIGGADENTFFLSTNANSIFVPGPNIIAVEVHQQSLTSSDVGFDLMIFSAAPACPSPRIVRGPTEGQATISWTGTGQLYSSPNVEGPYTTLAATTSPFTFTTTGGPLFFVVRCN